MTAVILLQRLKEFVQEHTKDMVLRVKPITHNVYGEDAKAEGITERPPEVHLMRLPSKDAEINRIPYILLQWLAGKDDQQQGEHPESECKIRIIAATYSDNDSEGALDVLNVMTKIRIALLRAGEIGEQFLLRKPLEALVYPDDTQPYFFGEMMSVWEMPTIKREVNLGE